MQTTSSRLVVGEIIQEYRTAKWMGESTNHGMSVHRQQGLFYPYVYDIKLAGKKLNVEPISKNVDEQRNSGEIIYVT